MANRLTTEILINLAGNLTAKARQYGANMSEFARTNQRAMSVVKATTAAAGRGLDALGNRYTTMIAGFAGGAMLRDFAATDRRITRMGLAAEKTKKEMSEMFGGMQDAAIKFRVDDSEVVSAIEKVGTVTGDIDYGYKNRNIIAPSIAASGADGESIGGLFSQFTKFNLSNEKDTLQAMDTLNQLGKEGAFELKDIAERGVKAFSMYAAAGGTGVRGVKDVGVALESAVDATGDTTTASTAVENLIRDLQLPKVVKELRRNGINVFGKDGKMRSLPTLMGEIAKKSGNKGAETQSARLLGAGFNQDSILLLSSVTSGKGAENLKRYNGVVADGQGIMKDAEYASKDFTSAVTALNTTWKKFANSNLAKPVQELADAINSVDQETVQHWLEIGKNIAIAVGGVIAARKAFQFGKGVWDVLNPNKGKGIPNGIADVFGSGVMPVYVTNWPAGGLGGTGEDKVNDLLDTTADLPGWPGMLARGGLIASKLMGLTDMDPFSDEGREELLKRVQQNNERSTMWEDIKNFFTSSSPSPAGYQDPSPWASMQPQNQSGYPFLQQPELKGSIEVSVKDDRVQVTSVKVNAPGVTMSAGTGLRSTEQD
ncbi:TPA: phage tail tape measure protein [Klebsiella oxytoca]|uniref:Phage tail tape measure protein domain-containing protein n=1 Tax=Klebsiella grimontii TaxID=2058152 RepID=A0A285AUN1_9ENTR|nr:MULTISPECIES: phage tail tape measure protein [Enterobacteriaceae]ELQ8330515.1 phage tail tape measure protein [Klebsiella oxytoca]ELY3048621.1 phage tail tape measure protein [Klebsiella pneumoniae]MBK4555197.1 phage tail tape measure protein [Enterobacter hormaechei]MBK4629794.1 phage tail tape measure protein [Enterobacter hormaechei]MCW9662783.1 phage tail tape measure protein [Klebsiella oxytoca]